MMISLLAMVVVCHAAVIYQSRFDLLDDRTGVTTIGNGEVLLSGDRPTHWFVRSGSVCTNNDMNNTWLDFPKIGVVGAGRMVLHLTMKSGFGFEVRVGGLFSIQVSPFGYRKVARFVEPCDMWCFPENQRTLSNRDADTWAPRNHSMTIDASWVNDLTVSSSSNS